MYDATADDCGTVQALFKEVNKATEDGMFFVLSV
jgi:hypothetical protein